MSLCAWCSFSDFAIIKVIEVAILQERKWRSTDQSIMRNNGEDWRSAVRHLDSRIVRVCVWLWLCVPYSIQPHKCLCASSKKRYKTGATQTHKSFYNKEWLCSELVAYIKKTGSIFIWEKVLVLYLFSQITSLLRLIFCMACLDFFFN